jgi:hypothetical protein
VGTRDRPATVESGRPSATRCGKARPPRAVTPGHGRAPRAARAAGRWPLRSDSRRCGTNGTSSGGETPHPGGWDHAALRRLGRPAGKWERTAERGVPGGALQPLAEGIVRLRRRARTGATLFLNAIRQGSGRSGQAGPANRQAWPRVLAGPISRGGYGRHVDERSSRVERLRTALESRIAIEQAIRALARRENVSSDQALVWLRGQADLTQRALAEVAQATLDGAQPGARRADEAAVRARRLRS